MKLKNMLKQSDEKLIRKILSDFLEWYESAVDYLPSDKYELIQSYIDDVKD